MVDLLNCHGLWVLVLLLSTLFSLPSCDH